MRERFREYFERVHVDGPEQRAFREQAKRRGFKSVDEWLRVLGTAELDPELAERVERQQEAADETTIPF